MAEHGSLKLLGPIPHMPAGYAPITLASALGYAEEDGLDLQNVAAGSPNDAVAGVLAGTGDCTFVNTAFGFAVRDRGDPLKMFFSFARHANRSFAVPADSSIKSIADLRGATIGLHFPDLMYFAHAALVDEGVDPATDVEFVPLPGSPVDAEMMTDAVRGGGIHAIWQLDLNYGLFEAEDLPLRRLPSRTIDRLTPSACLYTTDSFAESRPGALAVLGRSVARATLFAQTNPEAAVRVLWKHVPEARPKAGEEERVLRRDVASLKSRLENQRIDNTADPRWGVITEDEIERWQEFMFSSGAIKSRRATSEYFRGDLIDQFNDFDHEAVVAEARAFRVD